MKNFLIYLLFFSIIIVGSVYFYFNTQISKKNNLYNQETQIEKNYNKKNNVEDNEDLVDKSDNNNSNVSFDIIRITKDGTAVIAGRAPAGSKVTVFDNMKIIGSVIADPQGEWVLIPNKPLESGSRELIVEAELVDGLVLRSDDVVILSVPESTKSTAEPIAILSNRKNLKPSKVLQKRNSNNKINQSKSIAIDIIDYNEEGKVIVSGRASPNSRIKIFADGNLVGEATADESGIWASLLAQSIKPGNYVLRADKIDSENMVVARASIPFTRAKSSELLFEEGKVIIQPGNSLWRVARATYGSGFQYTIIYEANKTQIDDPDLIYPGQVFNLPKSKKNN